MRSGLSAVLNTLEDVRMVIQVLKDLDSVHYKIVLKSLLDASRERLLEFQALKGTSLLFRLIPLVEEDLEEKVQKTTK